MSKQTEALKLALEASEVLEALFNQAEAMHEDMTAGVNVHCQITVADLSKGLYAAHAIREALAEQPAPPPECKTDAEKAAFAFGWWKALEENRKQPAQQQEPVAWGMPSAGGGFVVDCITPEEHDRVEGGYTIPLYTSPPASKPWVGLTECERTECFNSAEWNDLTQYAELIEAKLKGKNNG